MCFTYDQFSKYRRELMGIAIVFIMFGHNTLALPGFAKNINSGLMMLAQSGVDMFFFLSGYGCYYSMKNNPSYKDFLKKRFIRIIPSFLIVEVIFGAIFCLLGEAQLSEWIWNHSLISFYTDAKLNEWFIASILLVYLVYPLIFFLVRKNEKMVIVITALLYFSYFLKILGVFYYRGSMGIISAIFLTRMPAFLIGSLFARKSMEGKKISSPLVYAIIIMGIISSGLCLFMYKFEVSNYWVLIRLLFIFVIFAVMFLWIAIREKTQTKNAVLSVLISIFTFLGPITLEVYLTHEKFLGLNRLFLPAFDSIGITSNVIAVILCVIMAYYLNKLLNFKQ